MENKLSFNPNTSYDIVELPSRGIFYPNKKSSLRVSHLTASDENVLTAPNFINNPKVIDELLSRKVMDKDINVEDIVEVDRQAILIFLRNTAFGTEYTVMLTDPKTNNEFKHTFDLSTIKIKDFPLVQDNNGEFTYRLPKTNYTITFQFLTRKQTLELIKMSDNWNNENLSPPVVTRELEFMIKSVDGERDPITLLNFINNLPISDSKAFRKFVNDNKPSLELDQETIAPSGEKIKFRLGFGVEFFRPFIGL
jgi:hypothetical protein